MAQIKEEMVVIKVSSLVRDGATTPETFTDEVVETLEEALSQLVGQGKVVEIIRE